MWENGTSLYIAKQKLSKFSFALFGCFFFFLWFWLAWSGRLLTKATRKAF